MSPLRLTARLGMNRCIPSTASGSQVAACGIAAATVPPVTFTWYHRGAAEPLSARLTVCVAHSDSTPPTFEYWFCIIARICSTSRLLPPCDGAFATPWLGQLVAAMGTSGPVKVEAAGLVQSTWNL